MIIFQPSVLVICFFTFSIHITESTAYCMRLAGVRTQKIATSLSFITAMLMVSRLSNMFQAPLMGALVDKTVSAQSVWSISALENTFRVVILSGCMGVAVGMLLSPTALQFFTYLVSDFHHSGSIPKSVGKLILPRNWKIVRSFFKRPRFRMLKSVSLRNLPIKFLILNILVTSIYTIGVLCSLAASAHLPEMRSTANQLSGIVNGMATIMFALFVDPAGARITDQAIHGIRPETDVRSVVIFLQLGRLIGTFILAQLLFKPFTLYIMWVTQLLHR